MGECGWAAACRLATRSSTCLLVVNETEAKKVRLIFSRYVELGSVDALAEELNKEKVVSHRRITQEGRTIGGRPITRGNLYQILHNPIYLGLVVHKGTTYQGLHQPILERGDWDRVQKQLAKNRVDHGKQMRARVPSLLTGLVFDEAGERLTPSHSNRGGLRYRYYISKCSRAAGHARMSRASDGVFRRLRSRMPRQLLWAHFSTTTAR